MVQLLQYEMERTAETIQSCGDNHVNIIASLKVIIEFIAINQLRNMDVVIERISVSDKKSVDWQSAS